MQDNILKTVDGVHQYTDSKEIAQSNVAQSLRHSLEKLSERVTPVNRNFTYLHEKTIAVAVIEGTAVETTFSVIGSNSDNYSSTELVEEDKSDAIFSVTTNYYLLTLFIII